MQLQLRRKSSYSVRAMFHVACQNGTHLVQARQIASDMQIPYKYLTQLLARLVSEGLLVATQGPAGGYGLARPATDITVLDVVEAAEGRVDFTDCVLRAEPCGGEDTCPIHDTWSKAQQAFADQFAATSLADLIEIDAVTYQRTFCSGE